MIDDFGLYPREEPFDPFSVMLFKALQVVSFLFFLALLAISPEAKDGKIDSKAEFIVTMDWPDSHPDDLDLFVQDPAGNIAWYRHREAGSLERSAFGFTRILRFSHRRRILRAGIERGWLRLSWRQRRMFGLRRFAASLELGEDLLDRIEVGRIFGQKHEARPDGSDGLSHRLSLVGAEIVEDDDVAWLEGRREELFDIGAEAFAVNGAVEQTGRIDAVIAQGGKKRRGLPAAMRNLVDEALAFRRPTAQPGHVGFRPEPAPAKAGSRR